MHTPLYRRSARLRVAFLRAQRLGFFFAGVLGLAMITLMPVAPTPSTAAPAAPAAPTQSMSAGEMLHPLDRQLEQATDGLGPSTATAAIYAEYEAKWDAELNRVYQLLLTELSPGEQTALREAQRAWLKSRDADGRVIDALYSPDGRSVPTMIVSAHAYARMNLTRERALCLIRWRERHAEDAAELPETP